MPISRTVLVTVKSAVTNTSKSAPLFSWPCATQPWQLIYIDYAEKEGQHFLVVVDSHSKWLEVVTVSGSTASSTIVKLRKMLAAH